MVQKWFEAVGCLEPSLDQLANLNCPWLWMWMALCLCVIPKIDWRPSQCVPCLSRLAPASTLSQTDKQYYGWIMPYSHRGPWGWYYRLIHNSSPAVIERHMLNIVTANEVEYLHKPAGGYEAVTTFPEETWHETSVEFHCLKYPEIMNVALAPSFKIPPVSLISPMASYCSLIYWTWNVLILSIKAY